MKKRTMKRWAYWTVIGCFILLIAAAGFQLLNEFGFGRMASFSTVASADNAQPLMKAAAVNEERAEDAAAGTLQGESESAPQTLTAAPAAPQQKSFIQISWTFYLIVLIASAVMLAYFLIFVQGIPLDQEMFKTLGSDTRSQILDMIHEAEKENQEVTLTDISEKMKISMPGAKQHMDMLLKSGLVKVSETHGKWKMFSLTEKARDLLRSR